MSGPLDLTARPRGSRGLGANAGHLASVERIAALRRGRLSEGIALATLDPQGKPSFRRLGQPIYGKVRNDPAAYSAFLSVTNRLPARLIYAEPHFTVRNLLRRADSGDDLSEVLAARLATILRVALTRVPHYRALGLDIRAEDVVAENAYDVLSRFPYVDKPTVMRSPEAFVAEDYKIRNLTVGTSGGSTGQGIRLYRSASTQSAEAAFFHHVWEKVGYTRRSRVVRMAVDGKKKEHEDPCTRSGDRLLVSPYHLNQQWIGHIYDGIRRFEPQCFHAYPSCFEYLADYMDRSGLGLPSVSAIFLASERVTERELRLAESVFPGVPVVFHYGLAERTNLAWGSLRDGAIVYEFEKVYGHSENYAAPGLGQEIVGTSYWNDVMPLIRYRTQDYGEVRDGVLHNLQGREVEFLTTKSGKRIPGISVGFDMFTWDYVEVVQIVQPEPGKIEFHAKPRANFDTAAGDRILASQEARWGDFFDLSLILTDDIKRTPTGKIIRYIVNRPTTD